MGIQGLAKKTFDNLRGGRMTTRNLTKMIPEAALVAKDIMFRGDGVARKRPGHIKVGTYSDGQAVHKLFDFERASDKTQHIVGHEGTKIVFSDTSLGSQTVLSSSELTTTRFNWATSSFGLFGSDGNNVYAEYNISSTETLVKPITAPTTAPTVALSGGTLTLTYGRQYMFCYVAKWTDSLGNSYYHIGPPSPISANTGPFQNNVVNVGGLTVSTNPRVTHKWIFSTTDIAAGQASNFIFCGEVTNATTSFGDSQTVLQLDPTRVAPIDNLPWVPCKKLIEYQGRIALLGIPSDPASVYVTGLEEIALGIPQETVPAEVRFTVPGKNKTISGGAEFNQTLMLCTPEMWFQITGYDQTTFQKQDDILEPGACGFEAICVIQGSLVWVGPDKKIWGWDGSTIPIDLSQKLQQPLYSVLSMNDISDAQLPNVIVRGLNFGKMHLIWVGVSTDGAAGVNWVQCWDASTFVAASGYATYLSDGATVGLTESDFFFLQRFLTIEPVQVTNTKYLMMGDGSGNVYRWPDPGTGTAGTDAGSQCNVTATSVTSNVVTVTCANSFTAGQQVALNNLTVHPELNYPNAGLFTVLSSGLSGSQFKANFTHKDYTTASESTGTATSNPIVAQWGSIWEDNDMSDVIKKFMWTDVWTDRQDALATYGMSAVSTDGVNMQASLVPLPTEAKPAQYGVDPTMFRGKMMSQAGTSAGCFTRVVITFPTDINDAGVQKVEISQVPLAQTVP